METLPRVDNILLYGALFTAENQLWLNGTALVAIIRTRYFIETILSSRRSVVFYAWDNSSRCCEVEVKYACGGRGEHEYGSHHVYVVRLCNLTSRPRGLLLFP